MGFEHDHVESGPGQDAGGHETVGSGADDDGVGSLRHEGKVPQTAPRDVPSRYHASVFIDSAVMATAVARLAAGELVAFPTDTVYGLGADAMQPEAVERIFSVKGRPSSRPLSVLVSSPAALSVFASSVPEAAHRLVEAFWPGALTVIVPTHPRVPSIVTAGGSTIGLRMPDHAVALALVRGLEEHRGEPAGLAAPSANPFGAPPPTTADEVRRGLPHADVWIVDGGSCRHGEPSTIVDVSCSTPRVLRHGAVTIPQIEAALGCPLV